HTHPPYTLSISLPPSPTPPSLPSFPTRRSSDLSTALELTDAPDVAALGRDVLARLRFAGVAKLDFKRDRAGRLWLLEINPRFNRSEEHTSELQSPYDLVCRLLLEKKKKK